jgi:redox-sensitive bicupin YhaK (pirin superfamily)
MPELVIDGRRRDLGGFEVARVLPYAQRRMVGPFIFFDHMGPRTFAPNMPRALDVRPHPHIGLATVTYLLDGEITHRDSLAVEAVIRPGEVNWMTAGAGISHSERFDGMRAGGGFLEGVQAWVALPETDEEIAPQFDHYDTGALPAFDGDGVSGRLIAGDAFGLTSAVKTRSPMFYAHLACAPGARIALPDNHEERALYVMRGDIECDGRVYRTGQMLVFGPSETPAIAAIGPATVMLLGGAPLGERHIYWNFVSSRKERIEQAKADWRAGRIRLPQLDDKEFIPLPAD